MALDFPNSPTPGQTFTSSGRTWVYQDGTWVFSAVSSSVLGDYALNSSLNNYIAKSFVNAKGDLISASADNTPVILSIGTNGQALLADSTQTSGLRWGNVTTTGEDDQIVIATRMFS